MSTSTVPKQIQAQADEAQRRIAELNTPPADVPPAAPAATDAPPAPPAAPAAPAPTDELAALRAELEKSEQRFRSLQGMHRSDRERSQAQIDALNQRINELAVPPRDPAPAPAAPAATPSKDVEEFGEETIAMVTRVATAVASQVGKQMIAEALNAHLAPVAQQVQQVAARDHLSAEEEYYETLTDAVPDWKTINVDPQFSVWLLEVDPMSGFPYKMLIEDAHSKLEVVRTIAVFKRFKAEKGLQNTPAQPAPAAAPAVDERAAMVEPGRTAGAPPAMNQQQGRTWTRAQIRQFYRDAALGKIPAAEAAALERDISLAQSQNRIVG